MLFSVSFSAPSALCSSPRIMIAGSWPNTLKNGRAALVIPSELTVVTQAMGRGITKAVSNL